MKLSYKQRIFFCFFIIFALFTICIIIIEQKEEKEYKTNELIQRLNEYSDLINKYIETHNSGIENVIQILPQTMRITILNHDGKVTYDKDIDDISALNNHLDRPEIRSAQYQGKGYNIRLSESTDQEYIYYANKYDSHYIRVALPYNVKVQNLLQADNLFIYIVLAMFIFVLVLLNYVSSRFAQSISRLKTFATLIKKDRPLPLQNKFPNDELGEIGSELVDIFHQKEEIKRSIELEKNKLIRHFQYSEEGLGIFSPQLKKIYVNNHFIRFVHFLEDKPLSDIAEIFDNQLFDPILDYINHTQDKKSYYHQIEKNSRVFQIQVIIFYDGSLEMTIRDVTKIEKNRILKQEMTSNITHELRTPVTSIRGYLETLSERNLPVDKQKYFLDKAYQQSIRLSNLIEDISLLSNIDESSKLFSKENIDLNLLLDEIRINFLDKLEDNKIQLYTNLENSPLIKGSYPLLYSVFANLIDNSINYAGENIEIHINIYHQDEQYIFLSFYDTGIGVDEEYLNRLFERFYRVSEGRTRTDGGSGLGLSIVKNAILLHGGNIQVKNGVERGLEFLFTLKK